MNCIMQIGSKCRQGGRKSENFADVINGSSLSPSNWRRSTFVADSSSGGGFSAMRDLDQEFDSAIHKANYVAPM